MIIIDNASAEPLFEYIDDVESGSISIIAPAQAPNAVPAGSQFIKFIDISSFLINDGVNFVFPSSSFNLSSSNAGIPLSIYIGSGGSLVLSGYADTGSFISFDNIASGSLLNLSPGFISSSSTCGGIIALY